MNPTQSIELRPEQSAARPLDIQGLTEMAVKLGDSGVALVTALNQMRKEDAAERARRLYAAAMVGAQNEMPEIVKDARNDSNNSRYARLETIDRACRPVYAKHGFSLSFSEVEGAPAGLIRIRCLVSHEGGHVEAHYLNGAIDDVGAKGNQNKTKIQGQGSTFSYLQRYLTKLIFNIRVVGEDVDGQASSKKPSGPSSAPTPPQDAVKDLRKRLWAILAPINRVNGGAPDKTWATIEGWLRSHKIIGTGDLVMALSESALSEAIDKSEIVISEQQTK